MNRNQTIALIIGAIVFVVLLLTTPEYQIVQGNRMPANTVSNFANQYDLGAAAIRGIAALAATVVAIFVLRSKEK